MKNLFENIPKNLTEEAVETLVQNKNARIERIISHGHTSPPDGWYDQDEDEWVVLLSGGACLSFADGREVSMKPGDCLQIPAHVKHRVSWTDPEQESVWIAVHY
jgi:cupin 2 domain-containing protein